MNIPYASPYKVKGLFPKLTKEFSIRSDSDTKPSLYIISPKDGSEVTNTFFIKVIDFLIDNIPDSFERGVKKIVNESHWSEMNRRSQGVAVRREEGIRVKTCLGTYVFLKNPNCKYDELINVLMTENYDNDQFEVNNAKDLNLSPDELVNVRKWTAPYDYMIYEPGYGMDLVASFESFDTMMTYGRLEDLDDFLEDDYISICKCIATKLKEVADSMERVKREHFIIYWEKAKFTKDYCLCLVKEEQVHYWECENRELLEHYEYLEDFRYDMIAEFPELETVDFVCWTYHDGCNIGIPMYPKENVINFTKYKEFAQNWFKV